MNNSKIAGILLRNDQRGEKAIALFQAFIAIVVFSFHLTSAFKNQWQTFSLVIISIASLILAACYVRYRLAGEIKQNDFKLHLLTIVDCALIFTLIGSYSSAYNLPLDASFRSPSIVFLIVFTSIRLLRFNPVTIAVGGASVLVGWLGMLWLSVNTGSRITTSYVDYMNGQGLLVGAVIEVAVGYMLVIVALTIVTVFGRRFLSSAAHIEDLAEANIKAEDNISQLESILNSSIDGIIIIDTEGTVLRANPAAELLFGYSGDALIGASVAKLMSKEHARALQNDITNYINNDESKLVGQNFESEAISSSGQIIPIELSITEFHGSTTRMFAAFIRNINERKLAEIRERNAVARFQDAVRSAMDGIIIVDEYGNIVSLNPAAEEIFGYRQEELQGKDMADYIIPEAYRKAHRAELEHYNKTGKSTLLNRRFEIEGQRKNGKYFDLELAIKDIDGPDGKLFIGYARDITGRKKVEADLLESKERAEIASRAKASFLAMMSHEIRTPLNGVLGIMGLLQEEELTTKQKRYVKTANTSGRALLAILNDVLDFSKLEVGKLEIEKHPFLVDPLIDSVVSLLKPSTTQKNLEIRTSIKPSVPTAVLGDSDRIRQILLNLASNAVKFTHEGMVEVTVENLEQKGANKWGKDMLRFTVKDTGIGIAADKHDELFAEFTTIDASYSRKFGGTGLGLAISKALVDTMEGQISFESTPGMGTTFWFDLPLPKVDQAQVLANEDEADSKLHKSNYKLRILVAEDNATNQLVATNHLEKLGAKVDVVGNGLEAVEQCSLKLYDLILMDVSMPEMDGLEATQKIRNGNGKNINTPIIALTAYALDEDRQRVIAAGMDGFLPKPVNRTDLAKVLARFTTDKNVPSQDNSSSSNQCNGENLLFDLEVTDSIFHDMGHADASTLIVEFQKDLHRYIDQIKLAKKAEDLESIEKAAHGLKGVAGTFGASELMRIANNLNTHCRKSEAFPNYGELNQIISLATKVSKSANDLSRHYEGIN